MGAFGGNFSELANDLHLPFCDLSLVGRKHFEDCLQSAEAPASEQSEICVLFMNTTKMVVFGQNLRICFLSGAVARDDRTPRRWELACVA